MAQHLSRPNSGISTDAKNTGATSNETQSGNSPIGGHEQHTATANLQDPAEHDGVLDIAQNSSSAAGGNEEGSIRQDQAGYEGS